MRAFCCPGLAQGIRRVTRSIGTIIVILLFCRFGPRNTACSRQHWNNHCYTLVLQVWPKEYSVWQVALVQSLLYSCFAGLAQGIRRVAGSIGTIIVILLFCRFGPGNTACGRQHWYNHCYTLVLQVWPKEYGVWQVALVQSLLYSCFAGLAQGIRRVAGSIGTIIGPLWPSGMMHNMYAMFGVMVAVNTFGMVSRMQSILMNAHVQELTREQFPTTLKKKASPHSDCLPSLIITLSDCKLDLEQSN